MPLMTLFAMFFFHILDDFHLQGILASMKQKEWWQQNAPSPLYRNDYKAALVIHSVFWAMMIMIPICWAWVDALHPLAYLASVLLNAAIHAWTDDLKANQHHISLVTDQSIHAVQILLTWAVFSI